MRLTNIQFGLAALLLATSVQGADPAPSLDEALKGFDSAPADPSLEEALGGFDAAPTGDPALEEALQGFGDPGPTDAIAAPPEPPSPHRLTGSVGVSTVYAFAHKAPPPGETDYGGLARLRARLDLEYETDPAPDWRLHADGYAWHDFAYDLTGQDYPQAVLDTYQQELELGELWLRGRINPSMDLKLGRQIVVWGKSDNLRVTDVLNPLDQRELGMVDIEDLRLPVTMSRLDVYSGPWSVTGVLVHEIRFDKLPPYGSEFYPLDFQLPPEDKPANSLDNTEYGLALSGIFSGWDMALYAARMFDDRSYLAQESDGEWRQRHARITMLGGALDLAQGNWLWKTEIAHLRGLRISGFPDQRFDRTDLLLGVEYQGFTDTTLGFEVADRHMHDYQAGRVPGAPRRDTWQAAFRYQADFLHDRLHILFLATALDLSDSGAGFARLSGEYELTDALDVTAGVVLYQDGELPPLSGDLGDNDRVFLDIEYSF